MEEIREVISGRIDNIDSARQSREFGPVTKCSFIMRNDGK